MKMKSSLMWGLSLAVLFCLAASDEALSRGFRGGGFRGGGFRAAPSRSRSGAGSTSRANTWRTSSRGRYGRPKRSAADKRAYQRAKTRGLAFGSRKEAVADFRAKHASKYPSTYSTEPAKRPAHIPQTYTTPQGRRAEINYNPTYGGYGYFGPAGNWIMYSLMLDAVHLNTMMSMHGYYYDRYPGGVYYRRGWGTSTWLGIGIMVAFVLFAARLSRGTGGAV